MMSLDEVREAVDHLRLSLEEIKTATNNFADENLIKRGGLADVYTGQLLRSKRGSNINVVIRRFHSRHSPIIGEYSFLKEVRALSDVNHINTISILGFCYENGEMIMIIECAVHGSLDKYLSDPNLTWSQRLKICYDVALALRQLPQRNGGDRHHDIKSSKILLDKDWKPKLFCFGFCIDYDVVFYKTTIYTDPDFIKCWRSCNSDVYSLGVIMFEVLCGRKALIDEGVAYESLLSMVQHQNLDDIIDPNLRENMRQRSLSIFSETAYSCLKKSEQRPVIFQIVDRLSEALEVQSTEEILEEEYAYLKIPHSDIMLATNDFADAYFIGSQRDGKLYKAELDHVDHRILLKTEGKNKSAPPITHSTVILKRINNSQRTGITKAFLAEIKMLTSCKNTKILSLLGFSWEGSEMILIYEGDFTSLHEYLQSTRQSTNPTWEQRIRICLDIVHGLKYLLNNIQPVVLHQRIQSANVLLDEKWNAKIANFRLSIFESQLSAGETRLTRHLNVYSNSRNSITDEYYMLEAKQKVADPLWHFGDLSPSDTWSHNDLLFESQLSFVETRPIRDLNVYSHSRYSNADLLSDNIYSIGEIFFEILTGSLANNYVTGIALVARRHFVEGTLKNIVDRKLMEEVQEGSFNIRKGPKQDSLDAFSNIAYKCLAKNPSERPTLEVVIDHLEKALRCQVHNFNSLKIPLQDIKFATGGFAQENKIGYGGYGEVYKGELDYFDARSSLAVYVKNKDELPKKHGTVAIKRIFNRDDSQGEEGFLSELDVLSRCDHPNVVSLVGFCVEGPEMILVYEFAPNGSLDNYLENPSKKSNLTWARRLNMCIEIAKGLYYLHTTMEDKGRIIHRDIKSGNILLGENFEARIADFGLSKIHAGNQQGSTINTKYVGTYVYLDPEYYKTNKLKKESDIYSFGVVLFEILSGTLAYHSVYTTDYSMGLAPVVRRHIKEGTLNEIIDSEIMDEAHTLAATIKIGPDENSLNTFIKIAYQCLAETQCERPPIRIVIEELTKALEFQVNRKYPYKISREDISFSDNNYIITGGFRMIYNGKLQNENGHKNVGVKRFRRSRHDSHEQGFLREFEVLFKHKHENIIELVGYCEEMDEEIIVYEHVSNGSLDRYLKDPRFTWSRRLKICIDIAKGLNFLHGGDAQKEDMVIHRDIKSSNILLTGDWKAKICGFELSLLSPINQAPESVTNNVLGSPGYCDPLYWETGFLTKESDVYSLGIVLFEILCGRLACPENFRDNSHFLDDLVQRQNEVGRLDEIVFEGIAEQIALKSLATFRRITFQCLHGDREERPKTGEVVVQLQKALELQEEYEEVWDAKLPRNYKDILDLYNSPKIICSTEKKKEIYNVLSKGILLEKGNVFFSIGSKGERNEMISASMFKFRQSLEWQSIQGSRFRKIAKVLDISNLNVQVKKKPQLLPPDLDYSAYFVFKFCGPRKSHAKQMYVNLKYKIGNEDLHAYFATCREDDWMQIELYQSKYDKADTNLAVSLESFSRCYCDSRAIYIEGIEFRAIDHVKQEEIEKFDQNQQGKTPNTDMDKLGVDLSEIKSKRYEVPAERFLYDLSKKKLYPPSESSAGGIIELPRHQVFSIKWRIESQKLTPTTEYVCYLVFKLSENCNGLHGPVIIRDQFSKKTKNTVYFRSPSP